MNRRYSAESFAELLHGIAERVPGCGIGTDVICGFPGESDEDFQKSFDRLVELPITYIHPFTYSVRPGSEAEAFGDQVPGDVKKRRTRSLKRLSAEKRLVAMQAEVGAVVEIMPEGPAAAGEASVQGWTDNYLRARVETPAALPAVPTQGKASQMVRAQVTAVDHLRSLPDRPVHPKLILGQEIMPLSILDQVVEEDQDLSVLLLKQEVDQAVLVLYLLHTHQHKYKQTIC